MCFTRQTSKLKIKKRNHNTIKFISFTSLEHSAFLDDFNTAIQKFKCSQTDSNRHFSTWNVLFLSVLNIHAPIIEKRVKRTNKSAWLSEEITIAQINRDFYHGKISNSGEIKQKSSFVLPQNLSLKMLSTKIETIHLCGSMLKT